MKQPHPTPTASIRNWCLVRLSVEVRGKKSEYMRIAGYICHHPTKERGAIYVSANMNELADDRTWAVTGTQILELDTEDEVPRPEFCEAIGSLIHAMFGDGPLLLEILDRSGAVIDTLDNERRRRAQQAEREHYAGLLRGLEDLGYTIVE